MLRSGVRASSDAPSLKKKKGDNCDYDIRVVVDALIKNGLVRN